MAKKNNVQIEEPAQVPEPEDGYITTLWAGCQQYQCRKCAFDTLNLDVMTEHLLFHPAVTEVKLEEPAASGTHVPEVSDSGSTPLRLTPSSPDDAGIYEIDLKEDQHG
ncbi:MAG: hypothetical protein HYX49_08955 [Chloroflexi bacterium]|nr:hypothetical protein [Chloroflexota bacterium]